MGARGPPSTGCASSIDSIGKRYPTVLGSTRAFRTATKDAGPLANLTRAADAAAPSAFLRSEHGPRPRRLAGRTRAHRLDQLRHAAHPDLAPPGPRPGPGRPDARLPRHHRRLLL